MAEIILISIAVCVAAVDAVVRLCMAPSRRDSQVEALFGMLGPEHESGRVQVRPFVPDSDLPVMSRGECSQTRVTVPFRYSQNTRCKRTPKPDTVSASS